MTASRNVNWSWDKILGAMAVCAVLGALAIGRAKWWRQSRRPSGAQPTVDLALIEETGVATEAGGR
ncbi:MAG TPA: hypothetical protein P5055_00995 [Candidatus Paceibacterota bacterium]|nr:hypothetical protein [Candidatus Paceibacterota bacterium]